jgi:hypothetical protein
MFQISITTVTVLALMVLPLLALESVNRGRGENKTPPPKTQGFEYGKFAATEQTPDSKSPKRGEGRRE